MKNLKLLNQPLDQKLIDFDKEKQYLCEKYEITIMTEENLVLFYKGFGQTWIPTNPGYQKGQQIIRELRSEVVHMKTSAVPPNLTKDLEEKIESQKVCGSQISQRSTDNIRFTEQLD